MRILEHRGKEILKKAGLSVPRSEVISVPSEAGSAYNRVRSNAGAVVKALVPVGERGKSGGVQYCASADEAVYWASKILGMHFGCWVTEEVLIEEAIGDGQELYAAITIDEQSRRLLVLAGSEGGINVTESSAILSTAIDPCRGLPRWQARSIWRELGMPSHALNLLGDTLQRLYTAALSAEAMLLEVNPLRLIEDECVVALDCVLLVDDFALIRQQELSTLDRAGYGRPLTELEERALQVDERDPYQGTARYYQVDEGGKIGFLCGGGGGSLSVYDALLRYGGSPANYTEVGGNPPARKVEGLTNVVLATPGVEGLLVCCNFTNNTQVDKVAQGVVSALQSNGKDPATFPVIFRFPGINEDIARNILDDAGITFYGLELTMEEAAQLAVQRIEGK